MWQNLKNLYGDSLFRNSFYLMLNAGVQGAIGFFFWLICARIFTPSDVGLATSLISAASLMSVFSMLGFNNVIVRFLPTSGRKNEQLSTAFVLTSIASIIAGAAFLLWAFSTHNPIVQTTHPHLLSVIFMVYVLFITLNAVLEAAFIAYRSTVYILIKNAILSSLKIVFIFFVVSIGYIGIVNSVTGATAIAFLLGYAWLINKFKYRPMLVVDKETISETKNFAIGNYFGTLFGVLPTMALTLIVVSRLGAQDAAFFYIPSVMVTLLGIIPSSVSQSLFAEVSHDENGFAKFFKNALRNMFTLLIPAVVIMAVFGKFILRFFGAGYAEAGAVPLAILAGASLINAANILGDTLLNIKKMASFYLFMNILNAVMVVVPAYFAAPYGLAAVAWSALFGQAVTAIIYIIMNWHLLAHLDEIRIPT